MKSTFCQTTLILSYFLFTIAKAYVSYECSDRFGEPLCKVQSRHKLGGLVARPNEIEIVVTIPNHGKIYHSMAACRQSCKKQITVINAPKRHPYYYCDRGACLGCDYITCPHGQFCSGIKCSALGRSLYTDKAQCNGCPIRCNDELVYCRDAVSRDSAVCKRDALIASRCKKSCGKC